MQGIVDNFYNPNTMTSSQSWFESFSTTTGNVHNYDNKSFPPVTDPTQYLTVTYYDNYSFRSLWYGTYTYLNENLTETANSVVYNQPSIENVNVIGHVTGSKIKALDGGTTGGHTWLKNVTYYDYKYRVIQTLADNYKGGTDRQTNVVDFSDKVLQTKSTHTQSDVIWKDIVSVQVLGNKITDISGFNSWNSSGAASVQQLAANQDGWLEVTASENGPAIVIGLSQQNPDNSVNSVNYGIYLANPYVFVYENGVQKFNFTTYKPGDVYRIERVEGTIKYYGNNVLAYTSTTPSS